MKQILILILGLFGVAQAQFAPTSAKTAFKNGISIGTRDSSAYAANDSLVVVINRQGRMMYRSTDGYWKILSNAAAADYVPYTGAVDNVNLGTYRLTARSLRADSIYANGSGGMHLVSNSGTQVALFGAGGGAGTTLYGGLNGVGFTFSSDGSVNGLTVGRGLGSVGSNVAYGINALSSNTTGGNNTAIGTQSMILNTDASNNTAVGNGALNQNNGSNNTAVGSSALSANSTGANNTAVGRAALQVSTGGGNTAVGSLALNATTGGSNTAVGDGALSFITTQNSNTAIGAYAGAYVTGSSNNTSSETSVFIGALTKAAATGQANQIVIGHNTTGNGSNTVTIGNSSVTDNYFTGNIRGGAFIKSGGTSSQFLKADGSVDGTSYATAASISGTTNYIPKFTSSSAVGNSIMQELGGRVSVESTNISPFLLNSTGTNGGFITIQKSGTDLGLLGASEAISASANKFDISARTGKGLALYTNASSTAAIDINTSNAVTLSGALSGTSLSMSGAGTFAGNITTKANTYNGFIADNTTALGGGYFIAKQNGTTIGSFSVSGAIEGNADANIALFAEMGKSIKFFTNGSVAASVLTLASTGAATFSSSVTANGYRFAYSAKSSNYTLTDTDDYINVTASCTITLPTAVGRSGKRYVIKCVGSVTATIASTSSQTIDGNAASSYTFGGPNFNIMIVYSDGANWFTEAWASGI